MIFPLRVSLLSALDVLEKLYLGEPAKYEIHLYRDQLAQIDSLFDQIIFKHGIKEVDFDYIFDQPSGWLASKEQKIIINLMEARALKRAS